jgi:hypothetical protein
MNWLINKKSQLSLENKITIYKAIIKPVWAYGIELWGCSKLSNTKILQTFQSKTLRNLTNAPWYISNIMQRITKIGLHKKQLITDLFHQPEIGRRLNRMWPEDLVR